MTGMERSEFVARLAAARAGDEAAFTVLFRAVQPSVLRYLGGVAPGRAEDLAGETWVQVVRGLETFEAEEMAAFRAWVLTIARHRWLDDQRARGRRPERPVDQVPDRPTGEDVAQTVAGMVSTEAAIRLIATLPPDQAEAVLLRVVADLDVATTARVMERDAGAVRVLTHRGLRRLRRMLEDAGEVTPAPRGTVSE
jgi:RNA polymerase sigma-70 factor (ECF subfamily)